MIPLARRAWPVVLGLSAVVSSACGPPPRAEQAHQQSAKVHKEREPHKLVARGKAFAQRGDLTRAEQYLTAALEEGAEPNEVLPLLLHICVKSGRYRVAIEHARQELQLRPYNVPLRFLLGSLHHAVGNAPAAREHLQRVIAQQPDHAEAHYALGLIARDDEGDLVGADRHFREYLRLRPDGPHAEQARNSLLRSVP